MHLQLVQVQTEYMARYLNKECQRTLDINIFIYVFTDCRPPPVFRFLNNFLNLLILSLISSLNEDGDALSLFVLMDILDVLDSEDFSVAVFGIMSKTGIPQRGGTSCRMMVIMREMTINLIL